MLATQLGWNIRLVFRQRLDMAHLFRVSFFRPPHAITFLPEALPMLRQLLIAFAAGLLLTPNLPAQSLTKPRTDALGDSLPPGAVARLGPLRLKHEPPTDPTVHAPTFSP